MAVLVEVGVGVELAVGETVRGIAVVGTTGDEQDVNRIAPRRAVTNVL